MIRYGSILAVTLVMLCMAISPVSADMAEVPGGIYRFPFPNSGVRESTFVKSFRLDKRPVTVAEFLAFVRNNHDYSKTRIKPLFADSLYLFSWTDDFHPPLDRTHDPVTEVSWFAAKAYCVEVGKRLPSTSEWERVAMTIPEGQDSINYVGNILNWYAKPTDHGKVTGDGSVNAFGIRDLHGKVWEWTSDYNSSGPQKSGAKDDKSGSFFCGGAGQATATGVAYPTFMRYSFRSSLKPNFSVGSLGFRCAQ